MLEFNKKIQAKFDEMCQTGKLFRANISGEKIWDLYISSFAKENDPIFRSPLSSTHNCNYCKNFIRRYGNIVAIDSNNNLVSMFDIVGEGTFTGVAEALSKAIKSFPIHNVFFESLIDLEHIAYDRCKRTDSKFTLGIAKNVKRYTKDEAELYGVVKANETRTFNHFHVSLPKAYVLKSSTIEATSAEYRDSKNVFKRAMTEIPLDTLKLVRDLINQGSLLDGTTHLNKLEAIISHKKTCDIIAASTPNLVDNWCWKTSYDFKFAKFKNELIGVLCSELAEGEDLNKACLNWNKRVDPANYMKVTAPITQKQIKEAKKFVEENDFTASFDRRVATIDDIGVSEIKHINSGDGDLKSVSIFDNIKSNKSRHKRNEFNNIEEVHINKFLKDILPNCTSVEAYLENKHENNIVTLTTTNSEISKPIFKWNNNYSWTYKGNLAGKSMIKEAVKDAGGNIEGIIRCSLIWNESSVDNSDLDLWCRQPDGVCIGYNTSFRKDRDDKFTSCSGQLDLDDTGPGSKLGVENIYFTDKNKLKEGTYMFWVNQYAARNSKGFKAEIEFDGQIFTYAHDKPVYGNIHIAEVVYRNGQFSITHTLSPKEVSKKEICGLEAGAFHKVNLVCLSPNHWGDNSVGNKHFFFMLDGCQIENKIRSFHNENLIPELLKHKRVLEVLGSTLMVEGSPKQLSGLGFNATVRDELVVKLTGSFKRVLKIKF